MDIARRIAAVQALLTAKFGVRQAPLSRMMAKVGRRLPRRLHRQAAVISEAQQQAGHPKLARQVDHVRVGQALDELMAHLKAIDLAERRKERLLNMAALIAFYILVTFAAFVTWLWWTGYV